GFPDPSALNRWIISPRGALNLIESGKARALRLTGNDVLDFTRNYESFLQADPAVRRIDFIDVGDPAYESQLGPTWYAVEGGNRWIPKSATIRMSVPPDRSRKLLVTGYAPGRLLDAGPLTLTFRAGSAPIGKAVLRKPNAPVSLEFPLPAVPGEMMDITIEVDRVFRDSRDARELGMVFGTFAIR